MPGRKDSVFVSVDETSRETSLEALAGPKPVMGITPCHRQNLGHRSGTLIVRQKICTVQGEIWAVRGRAKKHHESEMLVAEGREISGSTRSHRLRNIETLCAWSRIDESDKFRIIPQRRLAVDDLDSACACACAVAGPSHQSQCAFQLWGERDRCPDGPA